MSEIRARLSRRTEAAARLVEKHRLSVFEYSTDIPELSDSNSKLEIVHNRIYAFGSSAKFLKVTGLAHPDRRNDTCAMKVV